MIKRKIILNAHVVTPGKDLGGATVLLEGRRIAAVGTVLPAAGDEVIDAAGLLLMPGFVDIHSHGRSGFDFCDATDEAFDMIGRDKLKDGVTGFLATGLTRPEEELAALCGGLAQNPYGQYLRGVLEGRRDAPGEVRA